MTYQSSIHPRPERGVFSRSAIKTPSPTMAPENPRSDLIKVTSPTLNQLVESPLTISGEARGNWYFEASFPVQLYDGDGNLIAEAAAQAKGEWMTENFVPFTLTLRFDKPGTSSGKLVLKKDNPSGLPENEDELRTPIKFF